QRPPVLATPLHERVDAEVTEERQRGVEGGLPLRKTRTQQHERSVLTGNGGSAAQPEVADTTVAHQVDRPVVLVEVAAQADARIDRGGRPSLPQRSRGGNAARVVHPGGVVRKAEAEVEREGRTIESARVERQLEAPVRNRSQVLGLRA